MKRQLILFTSALTLLSNLGEASNTSLSSDTYRTSPSDDESLRGEYDNAALNDNTHLPSFNEIRCFNTNRPTSRSIVVPYSYKLESSYDDAIEEVEYAVLSSVAQSVLFCHEDWRDMKSEESIDHSTRVVAVQSSLENTLSTDCVSSFYEYCRISQSQLILVAHGGDEHYDESIVAQVYEIVNQRLGISFFNNDSIFVSVDYLNDSPSSTLYFENTGALVDEDGDDDAVQTEATIFATVFFTISVSGSIVTIIALVVMHRQYNANDENDGKSTTILPQTITMASAAPNEDSIEQCSWRCGGISPRNLDAENFSSSMDDELRSSSFVSESL